VLTPERLVQGLQCPLWLWRAAREHGDPGAAGRASPGEWLELRAGLRGNFPAAVRAGDTASTRARIAEGAPALLDAVFEHAGARVEIDVLERAAGDSWRIVLLVADERAREADRERAGLTAFTLRGCGLRAGRIEIWLPDAARARGPGPIDWSLFFRRLDVTRDAGLLAADAPADLARLGAVLTASAPPRIEPSPHCFRPARCPHRADCTRPFALDWIGHLPRLRPELRHQLGECGVRRIDEIPEDVSLAPEQRAARRALRAGGLWISAQLGQVLSGFGPPAAFLDFEAFAPAIPLYPDTRPFQAIPVQWSLRVLDPSGRTARAEFLADLDGDPRPAFAEALLEAAGPPELPVVVYSPFESEVLAELARVLPARADRLMRLRARLRDLQGVVRLHAYHAEQRGAYGLKRVLPAFVPDFCWDDLGVAGGGAAHDTWLALARGELAPVAAGRARSDLAAYCARDTEALDALLGALRGLKPTP
jgi:hypothetical protein